MIENDVDGGSVGLRVSPVAGCYVLGVFVAEIQIIVLVVVRSHLASAPGREAHFAKVGSVPA